MICYLLSQAKEVQYGCQVVIYYMSICEEGCCLFRSARAAINLHGIGHSFISDSVFHHHLDARNINATIQAFGEDALSNLYGAVLGVSTTATSSQLRKAYHKRALLYHPDKVAKTSLSSSSSSKKDEGEEVQHAKLKFQAISVTYQILSNDESRREYDETGELVEDDGDGDGGGTTASSSSGFDQWKA
ncbi:MAG: J domain-containing protein, partial [Gaiellaceae bacterium]